VILNPPPERGDGRFDRRAALLLPLHRDTFALGVATFGVFMRCHPATALRHIVDRAPHALIFAAQVAGKERRHNDRGQSGNHGGEK